MKSKRPFKGKVEIGKSYLTTWGVPQHIYGFVVLQAGWGAYQPDVLDKNKVWSLSDHFDVKTGEGHQHQLVQLSRREEIAYWQARLKQIRSVNSDDKLRLIKNDLDRIEERLKYLQENLF